MHTMTKKAAKSIIGSLGHSSKMPCYTHGTSAMDCNVGAKLSNIKGTPCHYCYAKEGNYKYPSVKLAHDRRKNWYKNDASIQAFVTLLFDQTYFRWKDSGDVQNEQEFQRIIEVANATPWVTHWLPTQERGLYTRLKDKIPSNLIVRISSTKIGQVQDHWDLSSCVFPTKEAVPAGVHVCPSSEQDNKCGDCRACWDPTVKTVSYIFHSEKPLIQIERN